MFSFMFYNNGTVVGGYQSTTAHPVPSVGNVVIFASRRYKVRKVIYDYSRIDASQGNELIVHIYCENGD